MVEQSARPEGAQVVIEVWSDLGCPWCDVGQHRLHAAIAQRPDADRFEVKMRSFVGTLNPYDANALAGVAESVGLDGQRVREIHAGDEYADRVRADRAKALEQGVTGVPFVFDRRMAAPGAQKAAVYGELLSQVAGPVPGGRAS